MMMLIDPYRYGVSGPATLEFKGYFDASGPVSDVWTFTDLDFGTAGQPQQAILAFHVIGQVGDTISSITVNGYPVSLQVFSPPKLMQPDVAFGCGIAACVVTTATIDISVTAHLTSGAVNRLQLGLYRATNVVSVTAFDTDQGGFADASGSLTIDTKTDGIIVAAGCFDEPESWTGVIEEYDFDSTGYVIHSGGGDLTAGGDVTVTCNGAGSTAGGPRRSMAVASFR